jgi:hypothetical protein
MLLFFRSVNRKVVNLSLTALGPVKPCLAMCDIGVRKYPPMALEWPADVSFRLSGVIDHAAMVTSVLNVRLARTGPLLSDSGITTRRGFSSSSAMAHIIRSQGGFSTSSIIAGRFLRAGTNMRFGVSS